MENPEEVLQLLERFTKLKQKEIPRELEDYLSFVARTGDTVYRWPIVKHLFREKLVHVITDFHDNTPSIADLPQCPNVDPFNYERMKRTLLERLDAFNSAPFTVQRICELLTEPRKQYTRIDKFMRAVEKNILVVSTQEPGRRRSDSENGDSLDSIVNGDLEVNVDIEMDNEAFGIDVPNTAAPAVVTPANGEDTTSAPPTTPAEEKEAKDSDSISDAANISSSDAVAAESDSTPEEPTVAPTSNGTVAESLADDKASPCLEEADDAKTASKSLDESTIPEEKPDSTQQEVEETDAVDSATTEDEPTAIPSVPTEKKETISELQPVEESHETNDTTKQSSESSPTSDSHSNEAEEESADDGQPQAKLAKLSDDSVTEEPVEPKETLQPVSTEVVDQEKDEVSSGSTTDSGGSSASVDSESVSTSTDNSASNSAEAIESVVPAVESKQQEAEHEVAAKEKSKEAEPASEVSNDVQTEAVPEIPAPVEVEEPEVLAATSEVKQADVVLESTTPYVAPDEMETASSAVIPENVMATDDEETNQNAADAVVPMSADVPETAKPDDNAMDVDESSVEPMDQ